MVLVGVAIAIHIFDKIFDAKLGTFCEGRFDALFCQRVGRQITLAGKEDQNYLQNPHQAYPKYRN